MARGRTSRGTRKKPKKRRVIPYVPAHAVLEGDTFTMVWPWPTAEQNKKLPVHGNVSRWDRAEIVKQFKSTAMIETMRSGVRKPWGYAVKVYRFYKPDAHAIDCVNMAQRMKAVVDGVVKGGLLPDDNDKYLGVGPMETDIDRERPRIEIEFTRVEQDS